MSVERQSTAYTETRPVRKLGRALRWRRGHAEWVGDVFAYRSSPSGWNESLDRVRSATLRELTAEEAHALRRVDDPIVAVLNADDQKIEVAAAGAQKDALLGPFAAVRHERE